MAQSTGPVVALALITYGNAVVLNNRPWDEQLRVFPAAALVAGALYLVEQASPKAARAAAWLAFAAVMLTRVNPSVPSPVESLSAWLNQK